MLVCSHVLRESLAEGFILAGFSFWRGDWVLGYYSMGLGTFLIFPSFLCFRQLVRQLVYITLISNNRASFHLWRKENLVKHQKVSKYYENDRRILLVAFGNDCQSTRLSWL